MPERVAAMPDIEAVVIQALLKEGIRAYSSQPNKPKWPIVTVQRTGGVPAVRQVLDAAVIDLNVWGTNKAELRDLADEVRQVIFALEGTTNAEWECTVTLVEDTLGLTYQPDPDTEGRPRYVFAVRIFAFSTV